MAYSVLSMTTINSHSSRGPNYYHSDTDLV